MADLNLSDIDPIGDQLPPGLSMSDPAINARIEAETNRRVEAHAAQHSEALTARHGEGRTEGERAGTVAALTAMAEGVSGDTLEGAQFQSAIRGMVLQIQGGSDKPPAEFLSEAYKLAEARVQTLAAAGGDGAHIAPEVTDPSEGHDGRFNMPRFLHQLGTEAIRMGDGFDFDKLAGSPEAEHAAKMLEGNDRAQRQHAALSAAAGPRGRVVPFPLSALRADAMFAEDRGDIATRRSPDYRRDLLVPRFRPPELLSAIGVMQMTIDNDMMFPILTASQEGAWYTETEDIDDESITVGVQTSSPKRFGTRNELSWMLLSSEGGFGHQALVTSEMARAQAQKKERQAYDKQGTAVSNAPTGVLRATGTDIDQLAANTFPTHANLLGRVTEVAGHSIPVEMGSFVMGVKARQDLSGVQRFSTGGGQVFNDTAWREGADGPGMNSFGMIRGIVAGQPAFATTQIPVYASADSPIRASDTYVIFGVWPYVACLDYGTAFLTIDDVSRAISAQTRVTLNSFHDVIVRLANAFAALRYDAG